MKSRQEFLGDCVTTTSCRRGMVCADAREGQGANGNRPYCECPDLTSAGAELAEMATMTSSRRARLDMLDRILSPVPARRRPHCASRPRCNCFLLEY